MDRILEEVDEAGSEHFEHQIGRGPLHVGGDFQHITEETFEELFVVLLLIDASTRVCVLRLLTWTYLRMKFATK